MKAAVLDIDVTQGDDYSMTITFTDEDDVAISMASQTFTGQVRPFAASTTSWDFTIDATNKATGIVIFSIDKSIVVDMPEDCVYDLQMDDTERFTFMKGGFHVDREVTR